MARAALAVPALALAWAVAAGCSAQVGAEDEEPAGETPGGVGEPSQPGGARPATPDAGRDAGAGGAAPTVAGADGGGVPSSDPSAARGIKVLTERGFYDRPITVAIVATMPGATIRYTTNGDPPTETTGMVYGGPVAITATTTLRAAAFQDGARVSVIETHTYIFVDDVVRQSPNGEPPPGWPAMWGKNRVDYGMDPDVVNDPRYSATVRNDLKAIPTLSIVMRSGDLFDAKTGIYANANGRGDLWERATSVELIFPDGRKGFQSDAGIRIRGGFSRSMDNAKHAFRLYFRKQYGAEKLRYPLFGDAGAKEFDNIDLRTFQNYSWSFQGDSRAVFVRDQFARDTQLAMGQQGERGDFFHLYLNGQYWGLYNTCERPAAAYGASYFGGRKDDYDVVKVAPDRGYVIEATDGTLEAWTRLYNLVKAGAETDEVYRNAQALVDVDNLIDYMLLIFYTGNFDAPISWFCQEKCPNNFYALRDRTGMAGFRFVAHDSEHTFIPGRTETEDRTGPLPAGDTGVDKSNPQWIFQRLQTNAEFRLRVADRVQRHFFNGGALTTEKVVERFQARIKQIDRAVVGESARWGDARRTAAQRPLTRDDHWLPAVSAVLKIMMGRAPTVLNQLKAKGLYSAVAAATFNQHGGKIAAGFSLAITAPEGTIQYTLDGSDPRLPGGGAAPGARAYSAPIPLRADTVVKARVRTDAGWSPLTEAAFKL